MKKILLYIFVVVSITCISCIGLYLFLFNSNIGSHPISNIETLLIDENEMPPGWRLDYILPVIGSDAWGIDSRLKAFKLDPSRGAIIEYVYRFRNIYESRYAYFFLKRDPSLIKINKYPFVSYQSPVANDWYFACDYNLSGGPMCDSLARYDDYIVHFSISADKEGFTPAQLKEVLQSTDDLMKAFLKK